MTELITASYHRDFEACRLLCESIDRYVTGHSTHFIVVASEDVTLFRKLAGPRRQIVDATTLLPRMWTLPIAWRGRRYSWVRGMSAPIFGWHLQQLRKIAMTLAVSDETVLHIDSDNCFCRPFDVKTLMRGGVPLRKEAAAVDAELPQHVVWWQNAHRLLGLAAPHLPGDDYVGQMIAWDRETVARMTARIEQVSQKPWWLALAAARDFSEYMLYGVMVANDPALTKRHSFTAESPCLAYWGGPPLDARSLAAFAAGLGPRQAAIAVQSFTQTPIEVIRDFALTQEAVP